MIPENFIKLYESSFRENWDLPALTDYNEQRTLTYEDMAREIAKLHILFRHCQIRRGDKIALVGKNTSNWYRLYGYRFVWCYFGSDPSRVQSS